MVEVWRDIIITKNGGVVFDFTGKYQVSSEGRVRSLNYRSTGEIKLMKQHKNNCGYLYVGLYVNGKQENFYVGRLVATAFIPNPDNLPEVNHINENKEDNRIENLEWCDRDYNCNHGTRNEKVAKAKCKKVVCIETGEIFESTNDVERKLGLAHDGISRCCNGKRKTCGKLHWQFYKDYLLEINNKNEDLLAV